MSDEKYQLCPDREEAWGWLSEAAEAEVAFQEQFMNAEEAARAVYGCSRFRSPSRHSCDGVVRRLNGVTRARRL